MPELPEVEATRRLLAPAMLGARVERVLLRRANLRRPFCWDFVDRLTGAVVTDVGRRAKHLLLDLSTGDTLLMHLGMSGDFRVEHRGLAPGEDQPRDAHDHVVFEMSSGWIVTFNDPRRFGAMDLLTADERAAHPTLAELGPEPLSREFTAAALAAACTGRRTAIKVALLDQRVVAGLGNIYAAEALHLAGISPRRRASTLATRAGAPRETAERLTVAVRAVLRKAIARHTGGSYRTNPFRVYDRAGEPCPTPGCGGTIARIVQAGRSTFFCGTCQR